MFNFFFDLVDTIYFKVRTKSNPMVAQIDNNTVQTRVFLSSRCLINLSVFKIDIFIPLLK